MKKNSFYALYGCLIVIFCIGQSLFAQKRIKIINADQTYKDGDFPNAIVLNGHIKTQHKGAMMNCEKALLYPKTNILKAYGNVYINQGDTIHQYADYLRYNGNTLKGISWGDVHLEDQKMTLTTDTLHFNRETQEAWYRDGGTIVDSLRTLTSVKGRYYIKQKRFSAQEQVVVKGKDSTKLFSEHLDYLLHTKQLKFYQETTIINPKKKVKIITNAGDYDTKAKFAHLRGHVRVYNKANTIVADSIFQDQKIEKSILMGNVKMTDTVNKTITYGEYGEYFKKIDSAFIVKKALAVKILKKDSIFMHGDTILMTTKPNKKKIVRVYHHVKIFKPNMSAKCDSLRYDQEKGVVHLYKKPILWTKKNQMTGAIIYFTIKKKKIDSLFIQKNSFIIQRDTILKAFNQIKGRNMFGQFKDQKIDNFLIKGNGEVLYHAKDEEKKPTGISVIRCANIYFQMENGQMSEMRFLRQPKGKTFPLSKFPKSKNKLKGFLWREEERPKRKEDVFKH